MITIRQIVQRTKDAARRERTRDARYSPGDRVLVKSNRVGGLNGRRGTVISTANEGAGTAIFIKLDRPIRDPIDGDLLENFNLWPSDVEKI